METVVDSVLIVLAVIAAYAGWQKGAIKSAGALVGLACGLLVGLWVSPYAVTWLAQIGLGGIWQRAIVASGSILVVTLVLYMLCSGVAKVVAGVLAHGPLRWVNSLSGSVIGVATWAVAVWLIAGFAITTNLATVVSAANSSRVVSALNSVVPIRPANVFSAVDDALGSANFPRVFAGGEESVTPVEQPDDSIPNSVSRSESSVVMVLASKPICGVDSEGSGFVVSNNRVVTNAHVVAGATSLLVRTGATTTRASLVAFDPERDIAVLSVASLGAPALNLGGEISSGAPAYAAGYPGGDPFTISPMRVRSELEARGTDIYQTEMVDRSIYSLRGTIRPGNSGGPLLDHNGNVVGIVFARSLSDKDTGYALTLSELQPVLRTAGNSAISSGACSAS